MRDPDPYTPQEAQEARAYLREHGGEVQQMEFRAAAEEGREPRFLIADTLTAAEAAERRAKGESGEAGEEVLYMTRNDELIVDYWRYLLSDPGVGRDMPDMHVRETVVHDIIERGHR